MRLDKITLTFMLMFNMAYSYGQSMQRDTVYLEEKYMITFIRPGDEIKVDALEMFGNGEVDNITRMIFHRQYSTHTKKKNFTYFNIKSLDMLKPK